MSTIDITSSTNNSSFYGLLEYRYRSKDTNIPFVSFDEIALAEQRGWTVVASNEKDAIEKALRQTRGTGVRRWYPRKQFAFVIDNKGRGYAVKAERGDFRSEEVFFGTKSRNYGFFVTIIPVIDIVNMGYAVLEQVRRARGGDESAHIADGYWLKNIIEAPEEFLEDIETVQPVEARALRELRQVRREFKKAVDKATAELMKLQGTKETIPVRTFRFNEKIEVSHFDLNFFDVVNTEGEKDIWTLKTICLETNILDII